MVEDTAELAANLDPIAKNMRWLGGVNMSAEAEATIRATFWAAVGLGAVALIVPWVHVFIQALIQWLGRPKLEMHIGVGPPFWQVLPRRLEDEAKVDTLYLRVGVKNAGRSAAEGVEVVALVLKNKDPQGKFHSARNWVPQNLTWAYAALPEAPGDPWMRRISPGVEKYCNVISVDDPKGRQPPGSQTLMDLVVAVRSTAWEFRRRPGTYQIKLLAAAANARPRCQTLKVSLDPAWHPRTVEEPTKTLEATLGQ